MALCPKCGKRIRGEVDFCPYCNEELFSDPSEYRRDRQRTQRDTRSRNGRDVSAKRKEYNTDGRNRQGEYSSSGRRQPESNRGGGRTLRDEVKRLRKKAAVLTLSLAGMTMLAAVLGFGFIATAMNVSSLSLKAKNTEEKLHNIMDEYNALRGDSYSYGSEEESKNPFKAELATENAANSGELPVPVADEIADDEPQPEEQQEEEQGEEQKEEQQEEQKADNAEEKKEVQAEEQKKQEQPQQNKEPAAPPQTEAAPTVPEEKPAEEAPEEPAVPAEANDSAPADDGLESYAPLIPD